MVDCTEIDINAVHQLLQYDAATGTLKWKVRRGGSANIGSTAGWMHTEGYLCVTINGKRLFAHRLAWVLHHGAQPDGEIDHINGDRADNRIVNLRCVDHISNKRNTKRQRNNTSGHCGVWWHSKSKMWASSICVGGKTVHIGRYPVIGDAITARLEAEKKYLFDDLHGKPQPLRLERPLVV